MRTEELPVVTAVAGSDGVTRLIQMNATERYNPIDDASGFRSLLARLQLHLSIGEAS